MKNVPKIVLDKIVKQTKEENSFLVNCGYTQEEADEEIQALIDEEINAYNQLQTLQCDSVPDKIIEEYKNLADNVGNSYTEQLEEVTQRLSVYERNQKIDKLKQLFILLESTIGGQCYNGHIQNYGSWGQWLDEGREFKYPFYYYKNNEKQPKTHYLNNSMNANELYSAYYPFGANQLHISKAILKTIELIEKRYGLNFCELEEKITN
ncbi:hypothetical protein [Sulfurimonas sp. HSL3-7]|uniref:hypothetical protein n=1 Tax=Sulfonitrofixus jiaomeiensis TaxID=3131938 RepID=UPI0031F9213E